MFFDSLKLVTFLSNHPETKYLLAFNEPNFLEQANMTPVEVAALWPKLESIADAYNLEIVGPAVNFCGNCVQANGTTYNSPFDYLDNFFQACQACRVDHIAIHSYMNNVGALALMLPVTLKTAWEQKRSPSILLMPIAFASILGGMITMIGTPPNIIIASLRKEQQQQILSKAIGTLVV